jgi:threonine dehydrogenase-like Zn-dependent dehydrogenase
MKARVARLASPGDLVWTDEEVLLDRPSAREAACETLYTAISPGTELGAYGGLPALRPGTDYPRLVGYCNAARIVAVGSGVTNYQPGDVIISFTSHRSHFLIPEERIVAKVPPELDAKVACIAYLFHLGYQACSRGRVVAGHNVAILGLGALGLTSVCMAALAGARVFGISDHEKPRQIAQRYGAEATIGRPETVSTLPSMAGEAGIDVLVVTTNSWADFRLALDAVRAGGVISVLGFPGRTEGNPPFNPLASDRFYYKQLTLVSVGSAPSIAAEAKDLRFTEKRNMAYLLALMRSGRLDPRHIVSGEYRAERLREAYEDLVTRKQSAITYVLKWSD